MADKEALDIARVAFHDLNDLANAYPEDIFTPLTQEEVHSIVIAMEVALPHGSSRMHASWGRHLLKRVGEISSKALLEMDEEEDPE